MAYRYCIYAFVDITFKIFFLGLPCSDPHTNLVVPVKFTFGIEASFRNRIPDKFERYTRIGFLQLRAAAFSGDYYALCPGVRLA